ncbi:CU044_5270 family protein [Actinoallomurus spadix]|uniref:CU044_5270 family protein n=1 Tax=Actinoallomurus spadix TaxID=79912 RepID=A0ABP3GQ04_9ACTN|nr:CU044_5270 family protein [Actinoallomurus spadix]MCO5986671.1 CU044_5270 family protein [Actinoallomurus spadix]
MNELERMYAEVPPPAENAVLEGRRRLLAAAHGTSPVTAPRPARRLLGLPRMGVRLAAVGALAVTIAAGVTIAQNVGGTDKEGRPRPVLPVIPAGPVANAADLLNRAATAAESRPFAPRPDQWIYVESRQRFPAIGTHVTTPKTRLVNFVERTWWRADGKQIARTQQGAYGDGKLRIETGNQLWKHNYPALAALPTDPTALDAWVASHVFIGGMRPKNAEERAAALYDQYSAVLRNGVAPPKTEAAVYRAIARIPGVTLRKNVVDMAGRPAIAVSRVTEGYLAKEILVDPKTYAYLAERVIVVKDHTLNALDGRSVDKKGAVLNLEMHSIPKVVDRPGQRP